MRADDDRLAGLLGSVSDGEVIDWDAVVRRMGPAELPVIEALRDVDRIHSFNRGLQRAEIPGDPVPTGVGDVPRWGDLLLLERCGVGAQAEVYRAWDPGLRREVALKLLRAGAPGADAGADRSPLLSEGRALARIRHPHVVAVHGIDEHDGRVGLWMELVRGETLEEHVQTHGMLTPAEAARLGREIGSALAAVHAAGLLHRDIKPANIVRDADGRFVLTDFGLGLARRDAPAATAAVAGSPMYMAPELLFGSAPDARARTSTRWACWCGTRLPAGIRSPPARSNPCALPRPMDRALRWRNAGPGCRPRCWPRWSRRRPRRRHGASDRRRRSSRPWRLPRPEPQRRLLPVAVPPGASWSWALRRSSPWRPSSWLPGAIARRAR
ncbi:MAG: serine/threonine protein kinase [bacterium]|nr:serine/threonine protein kinase [bacterium]